MSKVLIKSAWGLMIPPRPRSLSCTAMPWLKRLLEGPWGPRLRSGREECQFRHSIDPGAAHRMGWQVID